MLTLLYGRSVVGDHFTSEIITAGDRGPCSQRSNHTHAAKDALAAFSMAGAYFPCVSMEFTVH